VALPFTLESKYLKAKEEIMETQILHHAKKLYLIFKNSSK
jgi:hypothetical protein